MLIKLFLDNPLFPLALIILIVIGGSFSYQNLPVEAFPDISPVLVQIFTEADELVPEEVESLISYPIESSVSGLPGVELVRSVSSFGLSVVSVYFTDGTDIYFARQQISERLTAINSELPQLDKPPELGPVSTGLGQIFIYYLTADPAVVDTKGQSLDIYLREINDWIVKYQIQSVPGVAAVHTIGGKILQYQIILDQQQLIKYNLTASEVAATISDANRNVGGQFLTLDSEEHLIRGLGKFNNIEDIAATVIKTVDGTTITVNELADIQPGGQIRRGAATLNGTTEIVSGIVLKLFQAQTAEVIENLQIKLEQIKQNLPAGIELVSAYNQANLIRNATETVFTALKQGSLLIALLLLLFLGKLSAATLVILSLPLCALVAFIIMNGFNISANLMSLGGIAVALGMLCDGSIVVTESILNQLGNSNNKLELIKSATKEVARPVIFSGLIVIVVMLPLFSLTGIEGKMFRPMALAISAAIIGSVLAALLLIPFLSRLLLPNKSSVDTGLIRYCQSLYHPLLKFSLRHPKLILAIALTVLLFSLSTLLFIGTEFMPVLEEGSIFITVTMAPSISLSDAISTVMKLERNISEYSEVEEVFSRIGRPEAGSHPHPVNYGEIQIRLKPHQSWKNRRTKADLITDLRRNLENHPGIILNFSQPIQNSFDEMISGVKTSLAIKIFGEDSAELDRLSRQVYQIVESTPGLVDLSLETNVGQPRFEIIPDFQLAAHHGISISEIMETIELSCGGKIIGDLYQNTRKYSIFIRYREDYRNSPEALENLMLKSNPGGWIPLKQIAEIKSISGPMHIYREAGQRRRLLQGNVSNRDLGSVFAEINQRLSQQLILPPGYYIRYGGQFENQQRAMNRLLIIVPLAIIGVFILLLISLGSFRQAALIFLMVPLSVIGGIIGLLITGQYLSVPASVGFIALFGMAMLDGLVMISAINSLRGSGLSLKQAVIKGSCSRLAPVLITTFTTLLGLLPLLISSGPGAEIQRPLAAVVVFGLLSSTLMTLLLLPAIYQWKITVDPARQKP